MCVNPPAFLPALPRVPIFVFKLVFEPLVLSLHPIGEIWRLASLPEEHHHRSLQDGRYNTVALFATHHFRTSNRHKLDQIVWWGLDWRARVGEKWHNISLLIATKPGTCCASISRANVRLRWSDYKVVTWADTLLTKVLILEIFKLLNVVLQLVDVSCKGTWNVSPYSDLGKMANSFPEVTCHCPSSWPYRFVLF